MKNREDSEKFSSKYNPSNYTHLKTDIYLDSLKRDLIAILIGVQLSFSIIVIIYGFIVHLNVFFALGQVSILLVMGMFIVMLKINTSMKKVTMILTLYYTLIIIPVIRIALGPEHPLPIIMSLYTIVLIILLLEGKYRKIVFIVYMLVTITMSFSDIILKIDSPDMSSQISKVFSMFLSFTLISMSIWVFKSKFVSLSNSLYRSSLIDTLTGAYNVKMLSNHLSDSKENYNKYDINFAVAMIDFDNFKLINDTYGHDEGDAVLCEFVNYTKKYLRQGDEVARYGGDEFILVFADCDSAKASTIMSRLLDDTIKINETYKDISLSFSAGICDYRESETLKIDVLKLADKRMYIGKNSGKNTVVCYS